MMRGDDVELQLDCDAKELRLEEAQQDLVQSECERPRADLQKDKKCCPLCRGSDGIVGHDVKRVKIQLALA